MMRETSINREHAHKILERAGWECEEIEDEMNRGTDYWLQTNDDGDEHLVAYGEDEPVVTNLERMSWLSP
jgi:hypothetical protein